MPFPLSEYEIRVKDHALLASIAFLVLVPVGVLTPRYLRTFTNQWWKLHFFFNFFVAAPVVYGALAMAVSASNMSNSSMDSHSTLGYAIFALYSFQLLLGIFIHSVRTPSLFIANHPPQNYIHAALGLAILAMAAYQVHQGLYTEWPSMTGNAHPIKESAKHAWLALVIIFWLLYGFGLLLLPRQYRQEVEGSPRKNNHEEKYLVMCTGCMPIILTRFVGSI